MSRLRNILRGTMFGIYLIIGAFAGIMAGLFGIGGGIIIIPALATIFMHNVMMPSADVMQMAVGTSLATVIITATSAIYAHHKAKAVVWPLALMMVPGLAIGAVVGAIITQYLPSTYLRIIFSIFLAIVSFRMFLKETPINMELALTQSAIRIGSVIIGMLSSILGVGGGTLLVPFLLRCQLDMHKATGTSVACGLAVATVATICFMVTGWSSGVHMPWATGYIYWPAFFGIAVSSFLFAPLGAALGHRLPTRFLKRIFAIFLLIMSVDMMFY